LLKLADCISQSRLTGWSGGSDRYRSVDTGIFTRDRLLQGKSGEFAERDPLREERRDSAAAAGGMSPPRILTALPG
jgi:hypothetical protein